MARPEAFIDYASKSSIAFFFGEIMLKLCSFFKIMPPF